MSNIPEFKHNNLTGAGLWFINAATHLYGTDLNGVKGIGLHLVNEGIRYHLRDDVAGFNDRIDSHVQSMHLCAQHINLFDQSSTKQIFADRLPAELLSYDTIDVSSSHVIRVNLPGKYIQSFIRAVNRKQLNV